MINTIPIGCAYLFQTNGTTRLRPLLLLPGEDTSTPRLGSLEVLLVFVVEANQEVKNEGERGLEGAVVGECSSGNNEQIKEDTKCGETDGDAGDNLVDGEEVVGESISEEEESGLEHEGQTFHDQGEAPDDHSVHLALSMPTAINCGSAHLRLSITVKPLFTQHGEEGGEEGSGQTRVKDGLDVYGGGVGAGPLRKSGGGISIDKPERDVEHNPGDGVVQLLIIRLEVLLDVDDKGGSDRREQTGLSPKRNESTPRSGWMGKNTHEDQRGIQIIIVFLRKVAVVFVGLALELVVEVDAWATGRSKEVWKERWQCFEHGILQTVGETYRH